MKRCIRPAVLPPLAVDRATISERDAQIVSLFTESHLTQRAIGAAVGLTGAGVWGVLHRLGVAREYGTWVKCACLFCGAPIEVERAQYRLHPETRFCSLRCKWDHRETWRFVASRSGGREARRIVARHFDLQPEHLVHHHDHDQTNNAIENLAVFASNSEHMAYHHGNPAALPIWDGASAHRVSRRSVA